MRSKTAILRPTSGHRGQGPAGNASWFDPENALTPNNGETFAEARFSPPSVGNIGRFGFDEGLPPFARLEELELNVTGAAVLSANPNIRVALYAIETPSGEHVSANSQAILFDSPTFMEMSTSSLMQRVISYFNDNPGLISAFSVCLVSSKSLPMEGERFQLDSFFLRVTYTTPPTPWKGSIHIQGDPMQTQKIKQGSNRPHMQVTVKDATGAPLDLRGCSLRMRATTLGGHAIGGEVTLIDPVEGRGVYEWREGDTAVPGLYRVELTTHWLDGSTVRIPHDRHGLFEIVPSLGGPT